MQRWKRLGLIFNPSDRFDWMKTHAQLPLALKLQDKEDIVRVFFASRDEFQRSQIGFVDIDMNNPMEILVVSQKPVLEFGRKGYFDEHGVYPSSIVEVDGKLYMYYIGWNKGAEYPMFYASVGLAISDDGGNTFKKYSKAPIMARGEFDPWMVTSPFVFKDDKQFKMLYVSGLEWDENSKGELTSKYHIKYAESDDGINWRRDGNVAIDFKSNTETNIAKVYAVKENDVYKAWYSYVDEEPYKIGYAESKDGIIFDRKDNDIVFLDSDNNNFDNEMACYPFLFKNSDNKQYMIYNGNSYGQNGLCLAVLEE